MPKELFIEEQKNSYGKAKSQIIEEERERNSHFGKLQRLGNTHENNEKKRNTLIVVTHESEDSVERPLDDRKDQ